MSQTTIKQSDTDNPQSNVQETSNSNTEMIKREKIEHTPFWLIYDENKKGWFITMLNYQMTLPQPTRSEALKDLDNRKWEIIAGMIEIIMVRVSNMMDGAQNGIEKIK